MNVIKIEAKPKEKIILSFEVECDAEDADIIHENIRNKLHDVENERSAMLARKKWEAEWKIEKERFLKFCETLDLPTESEWPLAQGLKGIILPREDIIIKRRLCIIQKH